MTSTGRDEKKGKTIKEFVVMMKDLYGEGLVALYLFGEEAVEPVSAGDRPPKMLAIMMDTGAGQLKKYASVHAKWSGRGIAAPLMMTEGMLKSSTDVFPIEFLEMKESNALLHGDDVLARLVIGTENLRRQCEEQVKGKLIHLQQGYMEAGGDRKALTQLIASSIEPFTEVMRNVVRLLGKDVPVKKEIAVGAFCLETGLDCTPFIEALKIRREGLKPSEGELELLFARYLDEVRRLAERVDKMQGA